MYVSYNPNPKGIHVGDCVIRACCKALDMGWEQVYMDICLQGFSMADMPSSNAVWGAYLKSKGFRKKVLEDSCPDCYTVRDFCMDHSRGLYVLQTGSHVVTAIDGNYFDTWDSGDEIPVCYWTNKGD